MLHLPDGIMCQELVFLLYLISVVVASIVGRVVIVSVDLSGLVKNYIEKSVTDPCVFGTFTP